MKRIFIAVFTAFVLCSGSQIHAGNYITEYKVIDATYSSLEIAGSFNVTYSTSADKMEICAQENVHDYIAIETIGKTLKLYVKPNRIRRLKEIRVILPASAALEKVNVSGASVFSSETALSGSDFYLGLSGASAFRANITASESVRINVSGASSLASRINTTGLDISISGSSHANLSGKASYCDLAISGASALDGNGDALMNIMETVQCNISGASSAKIGCDGAINGVLSGASAIKYKGNAVIDVKVSGSSSVIRN